MNPNLFDRVTLPFEQKCLDRNNWTPTRNNSRKRGNSHLPAPWQLLSIKCFWGPRSKLCRSATQNSDYCTSRWGFCSGSFPLVSLRLGSCAGAFTTHLGCRHDAKEDQASGTTHIRRCLATGILSHILNVRSVVSAAKSEHSDNPTMGPAEKLL